MKIGILVDSASTSDWNVYKGTNVEIIPLHITKADGTDILDTNKNVEDKKVWKEIEAGVDWKTSQASPGELTVKYEEMLEKYEHIVHIPITANLSSMMSTAVMVSRDDEFEGKVTVIQNENIAAQGIMQAALHLSRLIQNGTLKSVDEVVEEYNNFEKQIYIGFIAGDLKKLAHGGRAVKLVSSVLNLLKQKVLIKWQAHPEKEGMGRTVSSLVSKVIDHVKNDFKNGYTFILAIGTATSDKIANAARDELKEAGIEFVEAQVPNLYSVHAGVESIGFIVTPKEGK